jgi:hypothetical protein
MSKKAEQVPQQSSQAQPPRRPPDIVLPVGQPIPKGPGIEWWCTTALDADLVGRGDKVRRREAAGWRARAGSRPRSECHGHLVEPRVKPTHELI